MATPNRLKSAQLQTFLGPFFKAARVVTPTGIGVLLSVGAHAALIAYGPRTNFSFAALTQEDLAANPEETIVPIVQLSAAEQNRLPSFAQPRRPPTSTGLSSLQLPSGLPSFPSSPTIRRRPVPSQPIPSPTTKKPKPVAPLNQALPNSTFQPYRFNFPVVPSPVPSRPAATAVLPTPPTPAGNSSPTAPSQVPLVDENGLPILSGAELPESSNTAIRTQAGEPSSKPSSDTRGLSDALQGTQEAVVSFNLPDDSATDPESSGENAASETGEEITVENSSGAIAVAPAEGNPSLLLRGSNTYSSIGVSEEEAQENLQAWLEANNVNSDQVATQEKEITIESGFKACRDVRPENGLIGILVNPDGSRESVETIKSTGYGSINSLALSTLEYEEFDQPDVPTLYKVDVNVVYEPEGCVDDLPDTSADTPVEGSAEPSE